MPDGLLRSPRPTLGFYKRRPITARLWGWLGFGESRAPRPDTPEFTDGLTDEWFRIATIARFDWRDRVRILVSGQIMVDQAMRTDIGFTRSKVTSAVSVLRPGWQPPSRD